MGNFNIRLEAEELRSRDVSVPAASLTLIGGMFEHSIILLKITNDSNVPIFVSYDGITRRDYVAANGFTLYDVNANRYRPGEGMQFDQTKGVWVSHAAGTGNIYVTAFYAG